MRTGLNAISHGVQFVVFAPGLLRGLGPGHSAFSIIAETALALAARLGNHTIALVVLVVKAGQQPLELLRKRPDGLLATNFITFDARLNSVGKTQSSQRPVGIVLQIDPLAGPVNNASNTSLAITFKDQVFAVGRVDPDQEVGLVVLVADRLAVLDFFDQVSLLVVLELQRTVAVAGFHDPIVLGKETDPVPILIMDRQPGFVPVALVDGVLFAVHLPGSRVSLFIHRVAIVRSIGENDAIRPPLPVIPKLRVVFPGIGDGDEIARLVRLELN
jgi:hypothetical protein